MNKLNPLFLIFLIISISPLTIIADETLRPDGFNIIFDYHINKSDFELNDTIIITRTIINNESFLLNGLYLSDNLPKEFNLISYTLTQNERELSHNFEILPNIIYPDYNTLYWIVDDPDGSVINHIEPGDSLSLIILLTCNESGIYNIPLHTCSFNSSVDAFFSFGDPFYINYNCCVIRGDINYDNTGPDVSDVTFFVDYLFKGNNAPPCLKSADINNDNNVLVDDLTYLINYLFKGGIPPEEC